MPHLSPLGDPIGAPLADWTPCPWPEFDVLEGPRVRIEKLDAARHAEGLAASFAEDAAGANWTFRMEEPFGSTPAVRAWLEKLQADQTRVWHVYIDRATGRITGNGSLMNIMPAAGVAEVGSIMFAPPMQRSPLGTEAMHLLMRHVFGLGYRRYEWTCDPLNAASMRAAARLGFTYEALFRQAYVTKGRNRDKAVFAITDADWPKVDARLSAWLDPSNFDAQGRQIAALETQAPPFPETAAPSAETNTLGQKLGARVPGWTPPPRPEGAPMEGRLVRLEKLIPAHAEALYAAVREDRDGRNWTYLPYGPFASLTDYLGWLDGVSGKADPFFYSVIDRASGEPMGVASYLRIDPNAGSIEVGHIHFSPLMQRSPASTETMYLMMKWAFEAGYRRYEWKCDALNAPSRRAAQRLGLSYEGIFRQATHYKGRNRDTAWYAAIDAEWPQLKAAFETWLDAANFDAEGRQKRSLSDLTRPVLVATDRTP